MKHIDIITGASSGMGREFAFQVSADSKSDEIWLIARRGDKLAEIVQLLMQLRSKALSEGKTRPLPKAVTMDISGQNGVNRLASLLAAEQVSDTDTGGFAISLLVNNAGFGTYGPFAETSIDRELEMVDLNCTALTGICGHALPFFERGSILINTASLASFLPLGNFAVYGATKAYVLSFTMALAAEIAARGIKVCALCPGSVRTEFADVASNGARKEVRNGLSAEKVVQHCLKAARNGRHTALMAFKWKIKAAASRFVGRYTGAWFTYTYCKRPANSF
jgi:uncharacterized protein